MPQVAIVMPKMSMTMTEGELLVWHVNVGDQINAGDVVCEVATDKIDMEVEATASGTVVSLHGNPGDVMEVGTPLIMVESESDDLLAGIFDAPTAPAVSDGAANEPEVVVDVVAEAELQSESSTSTAKVLATPKAKATAAELGVDISKALPSGSEGVVTTPDVLAVAASAASDNRSLEKRLKTRLAIARAIEASADIPAFSMSFSLHVTGLPVQDPTRRTMKYAVAWANTLRAFPELHAEWNSGSPRTFESVKLAVSVMAEHGVLTPTIEFPSDVASGFESTLEGIIADAARGHIALQYLTASSSGFAELGAWPVTAASGILIRPQSTSIAIGRAHITAENEYSLPITITADHRLSDPADVALLAQRFTRELHN